MPFGPRERSDIAIIGGGVIGLTIARALRQRGVRDVMLIERGRPGAEASWAAGGMLAPQVEADLQDEFFQLACASRDQYPEFASSLKEETGIDVELDTTGTLYLGFDQVAEEDLRRRYEWQKGAGLEVEWLSGDEARRLEPHLSLNTLCALSFPRDIQIDNRRLVEALVRANEELGVQLWMNTTVKALRIKDARVCGVETSAGFVATPMVVVAAGAWSSSIDSGGFALPAIKVEPVRGQMLCYEARPQIRRHVIYSPRGYLVPRRDGRLLAGSTIERVGFDKRTTNDGVSAIKAMAMEISAKTALLPIIDSWAGLRPRAGDDLPVLGPCAEISGLLYATGHYRNGILLAPITGQIIADTIVDGVFHADLTAFSPDRFREFVADASPLNHQGSGRH
jgi:glycine oxidase